MRAARIHGFGGPEVLKVEEIPVPEPGPGELLVRQFGTSVNHRDIWLRKGLPGETFVLPLPAVLGIDVAGEVVAVGPQVRHFRVGDHVAINPYIVCGECLACRNQRPDRCAHIDMSNGGYAQFAAVPEARAVAIAESVAPESAACFGNTFITAWEMLLGKARITPEDTVFIWGGTSGLGSAAVQIARLAGCRVIATAGTQEKIALLQGMGVDLALNHHRDDVVKRVVEFTDGVGASVVLDSVATATFGRTVEMAAAGARIVCAGLTSGRTISFDVLSIMMKQFTIVGSTLSSMASARAAAEKLNAGALKPLIGHRVPLSSVVEAHRMMEAGNLTGKIFLDVNA